MPGLHETSDNGEFVTVNNTSDPSYPSDSYYVSYGEKGANNHVTVIYDKNGNQIDEKP